MTGDLLIELLPLYRRKPHNNGHFYTILRAGATGPVGPVLAGPIFVRKRGRVKLCTNAIVSVSMRKRQRTLTRVN